MRATIKTGPKRRRQTRRELPHGQVSLWRVIKQNEPRRIKFPIIDADDLHFLDADTNPSSYWYDERAQEMYDDYLAEQAEFDAWDRDDWFDREYEDFHRPHDDYDDGYY
jgi:hypothetical protein